MTRVASLCSGVGALDLAVLDHFGGELVWHSEIDPAPASVHAAHWPGVPNIGDLTDVGWISLEPIDVLVAGYPCQPFSHAGKRKGTKDERHLWPHVANAIGVLRPGGAVLENVAGHLGLGFDTVLTDLAGLGYDARWGLVRASTVGAPHRRERLFIVATDTTRLGRGEGRPEPTGGGPATCGSLRRYACCRRRRRRPGTGRAAHCHRGRAGRHCRTSCSRRRQRWTTRLRAAPRRRTSPSRTQWSGHRLGPVRTRDSPMGTNNRASSSPAN